MATVGVKWLIFNQDLSPSRNGLNKRTRGRCALADVLMSARLFLAQDRHPRHVVGRLLAPSVPCKVANTEEPIAGADEKKIDSEVIEACEEQMSTKPKRQSRPPQGNL